MFTVRSSLLLMAFAGALVVVCCSGGEKYSDKYDFVDVDSILANTRQRNQYYKCFADEGPCITPDSKFFRDHLREAIVTNCKKCTEMQKVNFDKISVFYSEKEPEKYRHLVGKALDEVRAKSVKL